MNPSPAPLSPSERPARTAAPALAMRVAFALGGTDAGRSGLGTWVRAVLPRVIAAVRADGGSVVVLGTDRDLSAYADVSRGAVPLRMAAGLDGAAASAAWHLLRVDRVARSAGADVLLMPSANRRAVARPVLPTVAVVHDLAAAVVLGKYDALRRLWVGSVLTSALRAATRVVAVSEATRRDVVRVVGIPQDRVTVVPNGVDTGRFVPRAPDDPAVREARARTGLDGPYVLYPSRLEHPGKNHLRLLEAFARCDAARDRTLALAGADWGARDLIVSACARLGLGARVRLLGYVDGAILPALVAGADALAMVGLREGFGLPAVEALACGVPVLAADAGSLPEVVGDLGVLADPLDPDALARGLATVLTDAPRRDRVRRDGPAWARRWDWDHAAAALLALCRDARAARSP